MTGDPNSLPCLPPQQPGRGAAPPHWAGAPGRCVQLRSLQMPVDPSTRPQQKLLPTVHLSPTLGRETALTRARTAQGTWSPKESRHSAIKGGVLP